MQRNLFSYIWRYSRPEQIVILMLVVLAQVFYFLSLSVPKSIVNNGITGIAFKDQHDHPLPGVGARSCRPSSSARSSASSTASRSTSCSTWWS